MDDLGTAGAVFVPSFAATAIPDFRMAIEPVLRDFVDPSTGIFRSVDGVIEALKQNYPLLQRPQR
jgi:hypothetical protein